ncbi:MAG: hypothetical protein M3N28_09875, partial [Actinomycetota bacterium]|nr:hypothetical protein [Actinomycetota bacterium]
EERARATQDGANDAATALEQAQARANPLMAPLGPADPMAPFTAPAESSAYASAQRAATEAKAEASATRTKALKEAKEAEFSSSWGALYLEDRDWFLATGDIKHAVTGYVVVSPDDASEVEVH